MAYTFRPTKVELGNRGEQVNLEPWRNRMGAIGNEASQGAINSFERSSIDLANQAAAAERRGLRQLSQANTGFSNDASRLALQNQFMLENTGQATAAQNALANSFEQQRQAALGLDLNAQNLASQSALAQFQGNEQQRQFNENFGLESANNFLSQQTQTQANEQAIRQWELMNAQHLAQIEQFNKTHGLAEAGFKQKIDEYNWLKENGLLAINRPGVSEPTAPSTTPVTGTSGGSTTTETSSGSSTFTKTPTGQTIVANPPTGVVNPQPAATPSTPTTPATYTPEQQVQAYTGAKGLIQTLGRNVKDWNAFMARAAKQLNVTSLSEVLTPTQLADVKTKFNLFLRKQK